MFLTSTVNLWNNIIRPASFGTELFEICKTNKSFKDRDLSDLLNNIYILYDYSVHQYWINNIYQLEQKKIDSKKSMFDPNSNMHLIVNRYDDWQFKM